MLGNGKGPWHSQMGSEWPRARRFVRQGFAVDVDGEPSSAAAYGSSSAPSSPLLSSSP